MSEHAQRSENASVTECVTAQQNPSSQQQQQQQQPVLRLHGQAPTHSHSRTVRWDVSAVDNENMGRKKSKCCCIYHKPRAFGESSSEDECDADGDDCQHCHRQPDTRSDGSDAKPQ